MSRQSLILERTSGRTVQIRIICCELSMVVKEVCTLEIPAKEGLIMFECRKCRRVRSLSIL